MRTPTIRSPRPRYLLATAGMLVLLAGGVGAQDPGRRLPFTVGEELTYHASFAHLPAGTARMRVDGIDTVRGRPAYHLVFSIDGGIIGFHVHDRYESWIDTATLASLRHVQRISEGRYHRETTYEIYPESATFTKDGGPPQPSVADPLDDGSFVYAVRALGVRVGDTTRYDRYFRPDRNPVVLTGLRRDTVSVRAGRASSSAALMRRPRCGGGRFRSRRSAGTARSGRSSAGASD